MSQSAYDALMDIQQQRVQAFHDWMRKNELEFDGNSNLVDKDGVKYSTDDDF